MRKFLFLLGVVLFLPVAALAQDTPKAEIFGGYSYLNNPNPLGKPFQPDRVNLHGWDVSVAGNLASWIGLVGDFSGHYSDKVNFNTGFGPPIGTNTVEETNYFYLFGPRFTYRGNERVQVFGHLLLGAVRSELDFERVIGNPNQNPDLTRTQFAIGTGGGIDIKLGNSVAFRVIQADFIGSESGRRRARLSTGLVLRLGRR